jgi:dsRNA-specific ribonuclease
MKPLHPTKKHNILSLLKEDVKGVGHDKTRTIARAVKAIIGAIYFDQGFGWVKNVMFNFGLTILMPEERSC